MSPENLSLIHLARECDLAATRCGWCGSFGHRAATCDARERCERLALVRQTALQTADISLSAWTVLVLFGTGVLSGIFTMALLRCL
jgi:hypothetical protein